MKNSILAMLLIYTAGCSTEPTVRVIKKMMIPPTVAGTDIPRNEIVNVRFCEQVKPYTVGRYIDPVDSSIEHEASILYRVEESSVWNLTPNEPFNRPFRKYRSSRQKLIEAQRPLTAELETEIRNQKKLRGELSTNNKLISETVKFSRKQSVNMEKALQLILNESRKITELRAELEMIKEQRKLDAEHINKLEQQLSGNGEFRNISNPFGERVQDCLSNQPAKEKLNKEGEE